MNKGFEFSRFPDNVYYVTLQNASIFIFPFESFREDHRHRGWGSRGGGVQIQVQSSSHTNMNSDFLKQ